MAKSGPEKFGLCAPVSGDRDFDTGPRRPSQPPHHRGIDRARRCETDGGKTGDLGPRQLIIGPGQSARSVEQEVIEGIADAGARAAVVDHRLAVGHLAGQWRDHRLAATYRIGDQHVRIRKAGIGFEAQQPVRRKNMVVTALQTGDVAARSRHEIEIERKIERAAQTRSAATGLGCRPVRRALDHTDMGADIPAAPVVGIRFRRRLGGVGDRRLDRQTCGQIVRGCRATGHEQAQPEARIDALPGSAAAGHRVNISSASISALCCGHCEHADALPSRKANEAIDPAVWIADPSVKSRSEARRNPFLALLQIIRNCKNESEGICWMASYCDGRATPSRRQINRKKMTRPGGQPGGSGAARGG